jgi:hypothetical protein
VKFENESLLVTKKRSPISGRVIHCRPRTRHAASRHPVDVEPSSLRIAEPPPHLPQPYPLTQYQSFPWIPVLITTGLTLSTLLGAITAFLLYLRPTLHATQKAAEESEEAARNMQVAAKEMEKTALLFQQDLPVTMQEMQKAAEEWELVGKQVNFIVTSVVRPVEKLQVEKAAEWVGDIAGSTASTTASLSKRVASETSALANSLWTTINQFRKQIGWNGLSNEQAEEAKRLLDIGRQRQEARSWIAAWRGRTKALIGRGRGREAAEVERRINDGDDKLPTAYASHLIDARALQEYLERSTKEEEDIEKAQSAVAAVFAALERAQRAAEEAAASTTALELAIEHAESAGALSSSDEEDEVVDPALNEDDDSGASAAREVARQSK